MILCVRFTCFVHSAWRNSATGATLDTGGWLTLTRRGLAPRKMHQASLGALRLYSLGLRLQETINLQVGDIDKDRRVVHIRNDKGGRDRVVPLPAVTLRGLRAYYRTHRNPKWIFPALGHNQGKEAGTIDKTVSSNGVQDALRRTVKKLGIKKHVHPHVFRHSYATHLLEANVPIHHVQELLGHKDLKSNK